MKDSILRPNTRLHPKLIAHRGYTPLAPQNSLPAFQAAGELGFWAIETDVHKTQDGVLVCSHDATVDSMYDGSGRIAEMTYSQLAALRLRTGNGPNYPPDLLRIPTLSEYLELCRRYRAVPFIETKTADVRAVVETACRYFPEDGFVLSSVSLEHLLTARTVSRSVFIHHIFSDEETMRRIGAMGYGGVSYNCPDLSQFPTRLLDATHACGVLLCLRAGDSLETVLEMLRMGLDYIPTNCISALSE